MNGADVWVAPLYSAHKSAPRSGTPYTVRYVYPSAWAGEVNYQARLLFNTGVLGIRAFFGAIFIFPKTQRGQYPNTGRLKPAPVLVESGLLAAYQLINRAFSRNRRPYRPGSRRNGRPARHHRVHSSSDGTRPATIDP